MKTLVEFIQLLRIYRFLKEHPGLEHGAIIPIGYIINGSPF
jgi:hypothetical protein